MRRRGNRWECRIRVAGHQVSVYGRTQAEAQAKADEARRERRLVVSQSPMLRDWFARWLELIRDAVASSTWATYERHGRIYIAPAIGDVRLDRLAPGDIDRLHAQAARRVSANTVGQVHRTLSIALRAARRRGYRVTSALEAVDKPKRRTHEITPLSWPEVERLLEAAEGDPFEAAYALAVLHGLRQGELLGLRWEHVDLARRTLRVAGNATVDREGSRTVTSPKTDRRVVPWNCRIGASTHSRAHLGSVHWSGRGRMRGQWLVRRSTSAGSRRVNELLFGRCVFMISVTRPRRWQ